jgi:cytidine deaminase
MDQELFRAALAARQNAYAPYSHFAVGAAVRTIDGKIFAGCNVENASYGMSICAERNAIFAAVCQGYNQLTALCVTADTEEPVAPCGACRQVIAEFKIPVIWLTNCAGKSKKMTDEELLPYAFQDKAFIK